MKKEVHGILTEIPIILKTIKIDRRVQRFRNVEIWYVDGITTEDKPTGCIGYVTVIYRGKPEMHFVCGGIESIYDISITEEKMRWDVLHDNLQKHLHIDDADCFFTWRSGTVSQGWRTPRMFEFDECPDEFDYQHSS